MTYPTIAQVFGGRFGQGGRDGLVDPLLAGISAGRADSLSLRATAPDIATLASTNRSLLLGLRRRARHAPTSLPPGPLFVSLRGGLEALVSRLIEALRSAGVEMRTNTPVTALARDGGRWRLDVLDEPVDAVIITTPAFVTAPLLRALSPSASSELAEVAYSSVAVATLAYRDEALAHPLHGSGFVVPRREGWLMTAGTFTSSKWPELHPPGRIIVRCSSGRHGDDRPASLSDADLVQRLHDELKRAVSVSEHPVEWRVDRWERAFPQYVPGHSARVERIDATLAAHAPGIVVAGASMRGVGVAACVQQGRVAARQVRSEGAKNLGCP
jgi:oxygen-dependent protoporphyrinogen oxidase